MTSQPPDNEGATPTGDPTYPYYPAAQHPQPSGNPQASGNPQPSGYPQPYGNPQQYGQQYGQTQPYGQAGSYGNAGQARQLYPQGQAYGYDQFGYDQYGYGQYGSGGQYGYGYAGGGYAVPYAPVPTKRRNKGLLAGLVALVVAAAVVILTVGLAAGRTTNVAGQGLAITGGTGSSGTGSGGTGSSGLGSGGTGSGGSGSFGSGGTSSTAGKTVANATQQVGIVTVVSVLKYQSAESAGTGMILTSDGEVLTNNHVIDGATSITVTVESTGRSYTASVVGTVPTKDVAVLQLANASGLTTAKFASTSQGVAIGDSVTGVGNAGGTGTLTVATGKVTDLNQTITATDETGADSERLHDLIETDAPIMAGDSGGPLYDSAGEIIGIDTAASAGQTTTTQAYAIRIDTAMSLVKQIESGVKTTTVHIGLPGFLGVAPATTTVTNGVAVGAVEPGLPAAQAGITAGSVITAVGGTKITSSDQLHDVLAQDGPGAKVAVSWTDANGGTHTKTITLATGPAD